MTSNFNDLSNSTTKKSINIKKSAQNSSDNVKNKENKEIQGSDTVLYSDQHDPISTNDTPNTFSIPYSNIFKITNTSYIHESSAPDPPTIKDIAYPHKHPKKLKDKETRATRQNVLDPRTLNILKSLESRGLLKNVHGCVSTGKEANVYVGYVYPMIESKFIFSKKTSDTESKLFDESEIKLKSNLTSNLSLKSNLDLENSYKSEKIKDNTHKNPNSAAYYNNSFFGDQVSVKKLIDNYQAMSLKENDDTNFIKEMKNTADITKSKNNNFPFQNLTNKSDVKTPKSISELIDQYDAKYVTSEDHTSDKNEKKFQPCAIKIYQTSILEFKDRLKYIVSEKRFKIFCNTNPRKLVKLWAEKEVRNMKRLNKINLPAPKPIYLKRNVLLMTLIKEYEDSETPEKNNIECINKKNESLSVENQKNLTNIKKYKKENIIFESDNSTNLLTNIAPRLKDFKCNDIEVLEDLYHQSLFILYVMYQKCDLIHSDFSEYNLLVSHNNNLKRKTFSQENFEKLQINNKIFNFDIIGSNAGYPFILEKINLNTPFLINVIDLGQAVEQSHINSDQFIIQDIRNINRYFEKKGVNVIDLNGLFSSITKKTIPTSLGVYEMDGRGTVHRDLKDVWNEEDKISYLADKNEKNIEVKNVTDEADNKAENISENIDDSTPVKELEDTKNLSREEKRIIIKEKRKVVKEEKKEKRQNKIPKKIKKKKEKLNKRRK